MLKKKGLLFYEPFLLFVKGEFLVRRTSLKIKNTLKPIFFCALRKLKPVLADFLLTQDEKKV